MVILVGVIVTKRMRVGKVRVGTYRSRCVAAPLLSRQRAGGGESVLGGHE